VNASIFAHISRFHSSLIIQSGTFSGYARVRGGIDRELSDTEWLKADGTSTWGGVFAVEWINTTVVPFDRIPGDLTNPWNDGKHVKIGYDGTELETRCGERLRKVFDSRRGSGAGPGGNGGAGAGKGGGHAKQNNSGFSRPPATFPAASASSSSSSSAAPRVKAEPADGASFSAAAVGSMSDGQPAGPTPRASPPATQPAAEASQANEQQEMAE
jgi:hypothetical protein